MVDANLFKVGFKAPLPPIPHNPDKTVMFDAGAIRIGFEYRTLDGDVLARNFADDPEKMALVAEIESFEGTINDEGASIHVFDAGTGSEILRFDTFEEPPGQHYHYIHDDGSHTMVMYDKVANGDMWNWILGALRTQTPEMLARAGAAELAQQVSLADIARVIPAIEKANSEVEAGGAKRGGAVGAPAADGR
jgi:hypothetical protein